MLYIKMFAVLSIFFVLPAPWDRDIYQQISLPLALLFFVSATSFMRLSRHSEKIQRQTAGKLVSSLPVIALVAGAVLLSFVWTTGILGRLMSMIYLGVIVPLIMLLVRVMTFLLNPFFSWLEQVVSEPEPLIDPDELFCDGCCEFAEGGFVSNLRATEGPNPLFIVMFIALFVFFAFMTVLLFKLLANKALIVFNEDGVVQQHVPLDYGVNRRGGKPKNKLRRIYLKFLTKCHKNGISSESHFTSDDYRRHAATKFGMENDLQKLRQIYLPNRYGSDQDMAAAKEDTDFAKKLVSKLRAPRKR